MGKEKRVLRVLALSLTGIFLLLLLWGLSPGPEWLARFAAERYAQRYACDYSCHALVIAVSYTHLTLPTKRIV